MTITTTVKPLSPYILVKYELKTTDSTSEIFDGEFIVGTLPVQVLESAARASVQNHSETKPHFKAKVSERC